MPTRVVRILASALAVFLLAQPISVLAFASQDAASCCCKDNKSASCCRRSHAHSAGPALSSRDCCGQCHVSVRGNRPAGEAAAPATVHAGLLPALSRAMARRDSFYSPHYDPTLFQRPPPFAV